MLKQSVSTAVLFAAVSVVAPFAAHAQTTLTPGEITGVNVSPYFTSDFLNPSPIKKSAAITPAEGGTTEQTATATAEVETRANNPIFLVPSILTTEGENRYAVSGRFENNNSSNPFEIRLGYDRIDRDFGFARDGYTIAAKVKLLADERKALSVFGGYEYVAQWTKTYTLGLAGSYALNSNNNLFATGNLGVIKQYREIGGIHPDDITYGAGILFKPSNGLFLSADYKVKSDVTLFDDWTFTGTKKIGQNSLLQLSYGTNNTYYAGLVHQVN